MSTPEIHCNTCEMAAVPGGFILSAGERTTIKILNDIQETGEHGKLSYRSNPLAIPIPIPINSNQSIILTSKPLQYKYEKQIIGFQSKYAPLLDFLKKEAFAFEKMGNTHTTLFFNDADDHLVAYCATKCSCLKLEGQSIESLCPSLELAVLCVDERYRFKGIGEKIIQYLIYQASKMKNIAGVQIITLFAIPNAVGFYQRLKFRKLKDDMKILYAPAHKGCIPMYLPLPRS